MLCKLGNLSQHRAGYIAAHPRGERIIGMVSLETLGYHTDTDRSQQYLFPFGLFYPRVGKCTALARALAMQENAQYSQDLAVPVCAAFPCTPTPLSRRIDVTS